MKIDYPQSTGNNESPRRAAFFASLPDRRDCGIEGLPEPAPSIFGRFVGGCILVLSSLVALVLLR